MERYVIAAWGEWCDEIVRSQLFDGLKANAFNSIFVDRSRVGAIALLSIAQQSDLTPAQVATKAESAGFDLNANPKLKQLLEQIITNRSKVNG